jgi:microcin C transport system substrate-binding protein
MQGFAFNIRRPVFQDNIVREALAYAFDFEWSNKQFAYGDYIRTNSHFENSDLASSGLPSAEELKILEPLRGKIPDRVFTTEYNPPKTDGSGDLRANLRTAIKLLEDAGYTKLDDKGIRFKTLDGKTQKLEFEILYHGPVFERWVMPFIQNLKRMGVKATFRIVDPAQYQNRLNDFDFDMTILTIGQSESPGNEQREFWGSDKADIPGSRNYMGVKAPVIDDLVTQIIHATSREDLVTKTRALDRILLWNHYVIPMWHYPKWRIAYWDKLQRPEKLSGISPLITYTWWSTQATAEAAKPE